MDSYSHCFHSLIGCKSRDAFAIWRRDDGLFEWEKRRHFDEDVDFDGVFGGG